MIDAAFEEQTAAIPDKTLDLAGEIAMTIERGGNFYGRNVRERGANRIRS
jgi:hypothetical protein